MKIARNSRTQDIGRLFCAALTATFLAAGDPRAEETAPLLGRTIQIEVDQFHMGYLSKGIFTNTLWAEQDDKDKSRYSFYATYPQHALGKGSGCGGHGCNLTKGVLVGSFNAEFVKTLKNGGIYKIKNSKGDMTLLENRLCTWREHGLNSLECSAQTPLRAIDLGRSEVPPLYVFRLSETP
jgi:hypothetical protein